MKYDPPASIRQTSKILFRIVKPNGILLIAVILQVSAGSAAQQLSINVKNRSLEKVFAEIEKKTRYVFFYAVALLQKTRPVTVEMTNGSVEDVLHVSLIGQGLELSIQERTVFVKREVGKPVTVVPGCGCRRG